MHPSVMEFGRRMLTPEIVKDRRVVELGSLNVNGSLRSIIEPLGPTSYVGVDQTPGAGVDVQADIADLTARGIKAAELVVCTEALEHAEDWRTMVSVAKALLAKGGHLLVTTRSPGFPYHAYPEDHWRFTLDDFAAIFDDLTQVALELDTYPGHPGVFGFYRRPPKFVHNDLSGITVKPAPPK